MPSEDHSFSIVGEDAVLTEEAPSFAPGSAAAVLLPLPLSGTYDYRVPFGGGGEALHPGDLVEVPLGRRREIGVVWGSGGGSIETSRLREAFGRLPSAPSLSPALRAFIDWVADYAMAPRGSVLKMALPAPGALEPVRPRFVCRRVADGEKGGARTTPARRRVLQVLESGLRLSASELARRAGVGRAVVAKMAAAGLLEMEALGSESAVPLPDPAYGQPTLSAEQEAAAAVLRQAVGKGFSVVVLEGVTGSGKTETYFEAVAQALRAGKQVLILAPEIALAVHGLRRFERRFGVPPQPWHSAMSEGARRQAWRAASDGTARVVVGARSALFLPYADLGLIVVDEEHESAFKQEDGVLYHARDMAVVRGRIENLLVILASATPSLETLLNVETGRYRKVVLRRRHAGAVLPRVALIDLRRDVPEKGPWGRSWLAPAAAAAVGAALEAGEQSMLFLNRRGYAPLTLCRICGHRMCCPNCTSWLVEHRRQGRLQCHHCGFAAAMPGACPGCRAEDSMTACGPGVERVAEEVQARFPQARLAVVASDTLGGPQAAEAAFEKVLKGEVDILVGTQVLAKGLHFPQLTLVGVVDADLGLSGGDLRAGERTFQLLSQVAGRAGRGERPGSVLLQTYQPEHPVLQAMARGDKESFLRAEAEGRKLLRMPPFGRLAALIVSGIDAAEVEAAARALAREAPRGEGIEVLGPAPAPLAVLRRRHRWRFLLKAAKGRRVQPLIRDWLTRVSLPSRVRVRVDVDPYSFL